MIKTNKLVALGLLAAVGLNFAVAPAVSAAGTDILYTPGQTSGGGNGGGSGDGSGVANWTVDYPVATQVDDDSTTFQSAKKMTFQLFNTKEDGSKADQAYTGSKKVNIKLAGTSSATQNGTIKMTKNTVGEATPELQLSVKNGQQEQKISAKASASSDQNVATLGKTAASGANTNSSDAFVYLAKKAGVKGDSYKATLTWSISAEDGPKA